MTSQKSVTEWSVMSAECKTWMESLRYARCQCKTIVTHSLPWDLVSERRDMPQFHQQLTVRPSAVCVSLCHRVCVYVCVGVLLFLSQCPVVLHRKQTPRSGKAHWPSKRNEREWHLKLRVVFASTIKVRMCPFHARSLRVTLRSFRHSATYLTRAMTLTFALGLGLSDMSTSDTWNVIISENVTAV